MKMRISYPMGLRDEVPHLISYYLRLALECPKRCCFTTSANSTTHNNEDGVVVLNNLEVNTRAFARSGSARQWRLTDPSSSSSSCCSHTSSSTPSRHVTNMSHGEEEEYDPLEFNTSAAAHVTASQKQLAGQSGWRCAACCAMIDNETRTVCPVCFTKRHDGCNDTKNSSRGGEKKAAHSSSSSSSPPCLLWTCVRCQEWNGVDFHNSKNINVREGTKGEKQSPVALNLMTRPPGTTAATASKQDEDETDENEAVSIANQASSSSSSFCRCCGAHRAPRFLRGHKGQRSVDGGSLTHLQHQSDRNASTADGSKRQKPLVEHYTDPRLMTSVGAVFRVIDLVNRWRCAKCGVPSLGYVQQCRGCHADRFDSVNVSCPTCRVPHTLRDVVERKPCTSCGQSLHGAPVSSVVNGMWACACGWVTRGITCSRCRMPHRVPDELRKAELLQTWDFATCTMWCCPECYHANLASCKILVGQRLDGDVDQNNSEVVVTQQQQQTTSSNVDSHEKPQRRFHGKIFTEFRKGDSNCRSCGFVWHGALKNGGTAWRCACHNINPISQTSCSLCSRPNDGSVSVTMCSLWKLGDWVCDRCGKHNYRANATCKCGQMRRNI